MKKFIWLIILIALAWLGFRLLKGEEDTWIKENDGRWVRHGNPSLPIPDSIARDCYEQNQNRAFDFAFITCREDICGADESCARSLEREFLKLEYAKIQNQENKKTINQPRREAVEAPIPTPTPGRDVGAGASEPNTGLPTSTPTSTSPESLQTTNSNANVPITEPSSEEKLVINEPSNITIESPTSNSTVNSPFVISGKVKTKAGDSITIQITNTAGTVLISETAKLKNVDSKTGWGTYKITLSYEFSSTKEGFLVVSNSSNSQESLSIPLHFQ